MDGPWSGAFASLLVVVVVTTRVGPWVVRSLAAPGRTPRWLVVLIGVALVAFIGRMVAYWLSLPPMQPN